MEARQTEVDRECYEVSKIDETPLRKMEWMKNGSDYNGTDYGKKKLTRAIDQLEWIELTDSPLKLPFMQGEGIKSAIKEYRIPKVSHIAYTNYMAPYGFYGIRGHYKNGEVDIFIIDEGSSILAVCAEQKGEICQE